MTIEWLIYPEGSEADGEWTTITWSDGSQQQIPTNYSDGDGLERLADSAQELVRIQYFHIGYGGTSTYPAIWRFPDDVLVLHAYDDESFNCFFICRSKDLVECVTSWLQGEVAEQVDESGWYTGSDPTYYLHTREIMAFGATDLLSDVKHLELKLWNSKSRSLLPEDRSGMNANTVRAAHISRCEAVAFARCPLGQHYLHILLGPYTSHARDSPPQLWCEVFLVGHTCWVVCASIDGHRKGGTR
jgi:hypothetical protein